MVTRTVHEFDAPPSGMTYIRRNGPRAAVLRLQHICKCYAVHMLCLKRGELRVLRRVSLRLLAYVTVTLQILPSFYFPRSASPSTLYQALVYHSLVTSRKSTAALLARCNVLSINLDPHKLESKWSQSPYAALHLSSESSPPVLLCTFLSTVRVAIFNPPTIVHIGACLMDLLGASASSGD
ncbi:hypothetical protein BJ546DRAFT_150730 [Cryomyces antarcticus]